MSGADGFGELVPAFLLLGAGVGVVNISTLAFVGDAYRAHAIAWAYGVLLMCPPIGQAIASLWQDVACVPPPRRLLPWFRRRLAV